LIKKDLIPTVMDTDGVNLINHRRIGSIPGPGRAMEKGSSLDASNEFLVDLQKNLHKKKQRLTVENEKDEEPECDLTVNDHGGGGGGGEPKKTNIERSGSIEKKDLLARPQIVSYIEGLHTDEVVGAYIRKTLKNNTEMNKIRAGMDSQLDCLDHRLKQQEQEVADLVDLCRRRAEIEKKYSRDMENLSKTMKNKHRDLLAGAGTSVNHVLRQLILETGEVARIHSGLDEVLGGEMTGICNNIISDVQLQNKQCKSGGIDIQENVLRSLFELQNHSKIFNNNKTSYEQASKKFKEAEREKEKMEKEIKREKLEKSKKYKEKSKIYETKHVRKHNALLQVIESQLDHVLSAEAANMSVSKHYREEIPELMNCLDLTYHHHIKNLVTVYNNYKESMKTNTEQQMVDLSQACSTLDARRDKENFFQAHEYLFSEPPPFKYDFNREFTSSPEEMTQMKRTTNQHVDILRQKSEELKEQIEKEEKKLLHIINTLSLAKHLSKKEDKVQFLQELQKTIIDLSKQLIIIHNKTVQQESRYNYLKKSLILQNFCSETLPRPIMTKRKPRTQTMGLPKLFGGTLDEYYEATGEKIPMVIESCIKYINTFGMNHQGIFRIGGAHADITKFEEDFEKSRDPFSVMDNGNHLNSVAGVLKSYFRKLEEPLFSETYFDQFMNITRNHGVADKDKKAGEEPQFVVQMREVVQQWSEPCIVVTRYLFSFLNDLAQYSDETQMDPFNLAICFGPTLCRIPSNKDQVQHTNLVNDLVKNFIIYTAEIFNFNIDGPVYIAVGERLSGGEEKDSVSLTSSESAQPVRYAVAEFDFASDTPRALSFSAGETLLLYSQASEDWWRGNKDGDDGLIPSSYIRLVSPSPSPSPSRGQVSRGASPDTLRRLHSEDEGVISKLPSFKSNKQMWEKKTLDRKAAKAPDLLKDVLDKSQEIEVVTSNDKKENLVVDTPV